MKRWNGWGDDSIDYPIPDSAAAYLTARLGEGRPPADTAWENVVATVPESRLPDHSLINCDPAERLQHARGQSLPDWIALRSGRIRHFPDGIAYPAGDEDARQLLDLSRRHGLVLIPYGGGTSVVGHINPVLGDRPVLTVDMSRLNKLVNLDETSCLATFEAGVIGPNLEAQLRPQSLTLGHFPQSFEYSTLGGWIATRSSGQQSYYYGRIEELFAGGRLETPAGSLVLPPLPASAAGPDLRQLVLGSEGRFGLITRATVRVRPLPDVEGFYALFFRDWASGVSAVRDIVQSDVPVSMLRLSDPQETETTLALAGRERLLAWADRGLRLLKYGPERCLLVFGVTGDRWSTTRARSRTSSIARAHGGLYAGAMIGNQWRRSRFLSPYLRNSLWERGYAVDTLETAVPWSAVEETAAAITAALRHGLEAEGERVLVLCHLSHVYRDGASIYVTYLYRLSEDPDETLRRWQILKEAASRRIVASGGTISHQHGVGRDHLPYLVSEKGQIGLDWLEAARRALDPNGNLNPGKLLAGGPQIASGRT